mmetsp:Transcript_7178/g.22271  ORF Transcript_7178/g.22271 Transcript_7178/m.22271 type:complete len:214 (+) Transcript_7178:1-642(+)
MGIKSGGFGGTKTATATDRRITMARRHRDEGDAHYKRGDLIQADEAYGSAVQVLESSNVHGEICTQSGEPAEDQMLASCLSSRAQCVLDMAEGKGILPDGTPFISQFDEEEHFQYFRKQALKQAEESAEKACLLYADDKSLYRLGSARMLNAQGSDPLAWMRPEETIEAMKDAGRCLAKSIKANPNPAAEKRLEEVRSWLAERKVTTLYPEYV